MKDGRGLCPDCQIEIDFLYYQMKTMAAAPDEALYNLESAQLMNLVQQRHITWEAQIQLSLDKRARQTYIHRLWEIARDTAGQLLPEPERGASQEQWFAYVYSQKRHNRRVRWQDIADRSGYAPGTLKAEYSRWLKKHTTKNNVSESTGH